MAKASKTAKKAAVKKAVHDAAHTVKAAVKKVAADLKKDTKLHIDTMIENANNHLQERIKVPLFNDEAMKAFADNLKNHIVAAVESGEIAAEKKGAELLDYLHKKIVVPKTGR